MKKHIISIFSVLMLLIAGISFGNNTVYSQEQVQTAPVVSSLEIVKYPAKYLDKTIVINAEFIAFSSLGLDYKPAYREASKYIGVLIRRDDVKNHVIPLSEMKVFVTRELAEKNVDLEQGDKIKLTGKVFSTALGDPWFDASSLIVTSTVKKKDIK